MRLPATAAATAIKKENMDRLDALKVFCSVVEAGGFSRAADRLGISTSSVTNQISALETHFHIKLLNRTTRSMSLTAEGRQCYEQALKLLGDMSELEEGLQQSNATPSGTLRVDMPSIISRQYIAPALPKFLEQYPEVSLKITVGDRMIDMVEQGVDVVIRIGDLPSSNLIAKTIFKTSYMTCASPQFIARHGMPKTPQELSDFACLGFLNPRSRMVRPWQFQQGKNAYTHIPQGALAMDHVESLIAAAKAGCGIVQQMSVSLLPPVRDGELVPLLQEWLAPGPDVSVLFQQKHHRAAKIKAFVDFVAGIF